MDTSPGPLVLAPEESIQPPPWGLMADGIVGWHFFDAESGLVPEEISPSILPGGGKGRIVALAATPFAQAEGWASRAVVAIARDWAQETLRIFLMDLGLEAPSLHQALGLPNGEGVSDAFLYGASVQRIAQPAMDEAIFFASAGTATSDPAQILGHPRWNDLAGGFSEADATLLLFLPTDIPGADKILSRATDVLFLAGQGESMELHLGPAGIKVVAMLGPLGSPPEEMGGPTAGGDSAELGLGEGLEGTFGLADDLLLDDEMARDAPPPELEEGLSLAEGFVAEVEKGEFGDDDSGGDESADDDPEGEDSEGDESGGDETQSDAPFGEEMAEEIPSVDDLAPEHAPSVSRAFGEGELVSDHLGGQAPQEGSEFGGEGVPDQEVPDFGADFVDLPGVEGETEVVASDGQFGGEIIRGAEFPPDDLPAPEVGGDGPGPPETEQVRQPEVAPRPRPTPPERPRPMSKRRPPPKKRPSTPLLAGVAAVLLVVVAAVGTKAGLFVAPGFGWLVGEIPYPDLTSEGQQPIDAVLGYSLELDVYGEAELGFALEMRNSLRRRLPSLLFNLTAKESGEVLTYVLYAGPAVDVVDAENLKAPLRGVLINDDPESWQPRATPLAFYLGERGTLPEAQEFLAAAEAGGVLGYIVQVSYPDGTGGYVILSGAFESIVAARGWQLILRENGYRDIPLIERRGRSPE